MSKQLRNILICLAVIVVLGGAYFLITLIPPPQHPDSGSGVHSHDPDDEEEGFFLKESLPADVKKIHIVNNEGEYTVNQTASDKWMVEGLEKYKASSKYDLLISGASSFKCVQIVSENADNLIQYGLDKPSGTAEITYADGSVLAVSFGNLTASQTDRYACETGKNKVYLVRSEVYLGFLFAAKDYISNIMMDPNESAVFFKMELGGSKRPEPIVINQNFEGALAKDYISRQYDFIISSPCKIPLDSNNENSLASLLVLLPKSGFSASRVRYVSPTAEELAACKLDNPEYTMNITNKDSKTYEFEFSKASDLTDLYYGRIKGGDVIFVVDPTTNPWINAEIVTLASHEFFQAEITRVKKLTVACSGKTYVFTLTPDPDNSAIFTVDCNGNKLENTESFRALFKLIVSAKWTEVAKEMPDSGAQAVLSIRIEYDPSSNFNTDTIAFIPLAARRYLIEINGQGYFSCDPKFVEKVPTEITALLDGKMVNPEY